MIRMNGKYAIGADIGGSHISCAAVEIESGRILRETLAGREVDNQAVADTIIGVWADAFAAVLSKVPVEEVRGIGCAMPGPFDYVEGICYIKGVPKYEKLYGLNIGEAIAAKLKVPDDFLIRFMNDASSFAVGEAWAGSASGVNRSLAITLGTGFGSAFVSGRIPIVDGPEVPRLGCIYHLPYRDGIADDYFSTRWFTGEYRKAAGKEIKGVREIADLAAHDPIAAELFKDFGKRLALFLAPWLKSFRAEMLVIGGNISNSYNLFGRALEENLKQENCSCSVALSSLKEDAAILGSAYLLDEAFWKSVQHALPLM
jgi:glucokinase